MKARTKDGKQNGYHVYVGSVTYACTCSVVVWNLVSYLYIIVYLEALIQNSFVYHLLMFLMLNTGLI